MQKGDRIRSLLDKFSFKKKILNKRCSKNIIFPISLESLYVIREKRKWKRKLCTRISLKQYIWIEYISKDNACATKHNLTRCFEPNKNKIKILRQRRQWNFYGVFNVCKHTNEEIFLDFNILHGTLYSRLYFATKL